MADEAPGRMPKTVKNMDAAKWEKALRAAQRRGQPLADWLADAIDKLADLQANDRVIPPDERADGQGKPAPGLPKSAPVSLPVEGMAALTEMMRAAHAVSEAAGVPVPKTGARHFFAVLTQLGRTARGLPDSKPRLPPGQTRRQIGQTIISGDDERGGRR